MSGTEWTWGDVDRLLSDLKADGYDPTLVATVTSAAEPEKKVQINVERTQGTEADRNE